MLKTEEEAKKMTCMERLRGFYSNPQIYKTNERGIYSNDNADITSCLSSSCMHWRWKGSVADNPRRENK